MKQQLETELDNLIAAQKASTFFGRLKLFGVLKRARKTLKYDDYKALQNKVMEAIKANVADQLIKIFRLDEDAKGELLQTNNPELMWTLALGSALEAKTKTADLDRSKVLEAKQLLHYGEQRAMKAGYHNYIKYIQNPKYKHLGWADPQRTYKEPNDFLYPSEEQLMAREMSFDAARAQYENIRMGMPEIFKENKVPETIEAVKVKVSRKQFAEALYYFWQSESLTEEAVKKIAKDLGFKIRNKEDFIKICWGLFILDMWLIVYTCCDCEGIFEDEDKGEECLDIFHHLVYHHVEKEEKGFEDWMRAVALGGFEYSMAVKKRHLPTALWVAADVFRKRLFGEVQEDLGSQWQLIIHMQLFMKGLGEVLKQYDIE